MARKMQGLSFFATVKGEGERHIGGEMNREREREDDRE